MLGGETGTSQPIPRGAQHPCPEAVGKTGMEVQLSCGFLLLLLLAWLPAGLTHQTSCMVNASVGLDFVLQFRLQTGLNGTAVEKGYFNTTRNNGDKLNKGSTEVQNISVQLILAGTASWPEESDIATECRFKICLQNLTVKWYKPAGVEVKNQTNTMVLGENCTNLTSPSVCAADTGISVCRTFTTTDMQWTVPSCGPGAPQGNVTNKDMWAGLNFPLCIIFGFAIGTLLYMPIIGLLLWQRGRNRKGKLISMQVAEGNQLSTAALVTETEDLTYANLKFEKKETNPTSSDVVYTKIKPPQQKQSGGDAGAANTEVDVSTEGEDK